MNSSRLKFRITLLLLVFLYTTARSQKIFPENKSPQLVFDQGVGFLLEGPTMSKDGKLYFSDIIFGYRSEKKAGVIWTYDPETSQSKVFRSPSGQANGLMFDRQGRLVGCEGDNFGGQRVTRTDLSSGLSETIAGLFERKPFNAPNDVVIDESDNIYFSDPKFGNEPMPQPVHGIYKIDPTGKIDLIIAYIRKPNGLIIAPDQKTLYVSTADNQVNGQISPEYKGDKATWSGKLLAYDLTEEGTASFREELVDFEGVAGDGMTVDSEGNIYVALTFSNKLKVFSPTGKEIEKIDIPNGPVTNVTFGRGQYNSTLFITAGKHLYTIKTNKKGYNLPFE